MPLSNYLAEGVQAAQGQIDQVINLLTGVMTDQPVTFQNNLTAPDFKATGLVPFNTAGRWLGSNLNSITPPSGGSPMNGDWGIDGSHQIWVYQGGWIPTDEICAATATPTTNSFTLTWPSVFKHVRLSWMARDSSSNTGSSFVTMQGLRTSGVSCNSVDVYAAGGFATEHLWGASNFPYAFVSAGGGEGLSNVSSGVTWLPFVNDIVSGRGYISLIAQMDNGLFSAHITSGYETGDYPIPPTDIWSQMTITASGGASFTAPSRFDLYGCC